ncbi:MAG TPA: glutamate decarboxylase [Victivallales bacterium]|nr:glutamate decarboxylase [Victivallales bacterium]
MATKHPSLKYSTYSQRYMTEDMELNTLNKAGVPSKIAYQLIKDELVLEGNPYTNLASFVTTWMEEEADELIRQTINKNFIDHDEYPRIEKIHERCVNILAKLLHAPEQEKYVGTSTVGSSEAIMLAGLAHKFLWRNKRKAEGKTFDKPNIIMGGNTQICWDKFARYFDVEPVIIPIRKGKCIVTAEDVEKCIDENTICVAGILGNTFTGEYDELREINDLLVRIKKEKGWDIPLHVDGASGGFISMFLDDGIEWDFELEQVKTINLSGHKYGLVYPGLGWLIFRDNSVVPDELVFHVNYLGGDMPTYTLNFSKGSAMVVAQYYNFIRLGSDGYQRIVKNMMSNSDYLVEEFDNIGKFDLLGTRRMEPVVSVKLRDTSKYTVFDISKMLRIKGWIVPAYTMPPNAEDVAALRVVIKENFSRNMAEDFVADLKTVLDDLEFNPPTKKTELIRNMRYSSH